MLTPPDGAVVVNKCIVNVDKCSITPAICIAIPAIRSINVDICILSVDKCIAVRRSDDSGGRCYDSKGRYDVIDKKNEASIDGW